MSQATLLELYKQLAAHISPNLDTSHAAAYIAREIKAESHAGSRKEWNDIETSIEGLSRTARVRVQDDLADALDRVLPTLRENKMIGNRAYEDDGVIKMSNLPDHIQLLLILSTPPRVETLDFAHTFLHRPVDNGLSPDELLYQQIMSEPFTGSHWEKGYDEEVKREWTDSESSSDSEGEVVTPSTGKIRASLMNAAELRRVEEEAARRRGDERLKAAEDSIKAFKEGSYWLSAGTSMESLPKGRQGWRALTTRATAVQLDAAISAESTNIKVVSATVLQRELLFALSGRPGVFFKFDHDSTSRVTPGHPQVAQFSSTSLNHILEYFSAKATQAAQIRTFISDAARPLPSSSRSAAPKKKKTTQAFAEACRGVLSVYESWIADIETHMLRGVDPSTTRTPSATPLALKLGLEDRFGPILDQLHGLLPLADSPTVLLDELYAALLSLPEFQATLSQSLLRVFIRSAEPIWRLLGDWLIRGMPIPSSLSARSDEIHQSLDDEKPQDPEFFLERDRDISWTDEDFWENGYVTTSEGLPAFIGDGIEEMILEAGKARGLLRAFESGEEKQSWFSLEHVLDDGLDKVDVRDISARVVDYITPTCRLTTFHLRRALQEDCGLDQHLDAIQGLCYMTGHQVMNEWTLDVFNKIQQKKQWSDFQTLTSSLRDIVEARGAIWMNPSAIRIQAKRSPPGSESPIVALGRVRATYDVPFPLSQLFTSTSMELRSEVFAFLLQLRYAQYALLESRKHDKLCVSDDRTADVKAIWQVRQQLLWFIHVLLSWLTRDVFAAQTARFREELENTPSLKSMIALELEHTRLVYSFAFLHTKTQELHELIMTILEMCASLQKAYTAYVFDPASPERKGSRDRDRDAPRRIETLSDDELESDKGEEELSAYLANEEIGITMSKMRYKLNRTIVAFYDGVEELAGEGNEDGGVGSGETWSALVFALSDWRRIHPA